MSGFSAAPAVSIKPVLGGVEVAIRYITRAHERYVLRTKLNQAAVELLGHYCRYIWRRGRALVHWLAHIGAVWER